MIIREKPGNGLGISVVPFRFVTVFCIICDLPKNVSLLFALFLLLSAVHMTTGFLLVVELAVIVIAKGLMRQAGMTVTGKRSESQTCEFLNKSLLLVV